MTANTVVNQKVFHFFKDFQAYLIILEVEVDCVGGEADGEPGEAEVGAEDVHLEALLLLPLDVPHVPGLQLLLLDIVDADLAPLLSHLAVAPLGAAAHSFLQNHKLS